MVKGKLEAAAAAKTAGFSNLDAENDQGGYRSPG
jgi:hypothetical protein